MDKENNQVDIEYYDGLKQQRIHDDWWKRPCTS